MEQDLLGRVAMLGFCMSSVGTLVLFALHAIETWWSRPKHIDTSQESADAVDCHVHDVLAAHRAKRDAPREEPARRAA